MMPPLTGAAVLMAAACLEASSRTFVLIVRVVALQFSSPESTEAMQNKDETVWTQRGRHEQAMTYRADPAKQEYQAPTATP